MCAVSVLPPVWLVVVVSPAISAPLKLKASRGPPTPINRNQASQPRVGQSLLGKRGFDSVSILHKHTFMFFSCFFFCLEYDWCQELNQNVTLLDKQYAQHGLEIREVCVCVSQLLPQLLCESFLHRSTEIHMCIMIPASDYCIPLSNYQNTKNQLQPTKQVSHTHYLGRPPKNTNVA